MRKKRILQLGAGRLMVPSVQILQAGGYEVYVVDRDPAAPGFAVADGHAPIDVVNAVAVCAYAHEIGADLILAVNEAGLLAASVASAQLGLPNLSPEVARRALDKGLMRDCWRNAGLPQPRYIVVERSEDIAAAAEKIGYPVVVKPTSNWGSRGVSFVADRKILAEAVMAAVESNRTGRFIVESALRGVEATVEGLVRNGIPSVLAKSDKEHQIHPRIRVAMALNYPAKFSATVLQRIDDVAGGAALALGIVDGAFHCECMVDGDDVWLVEMGARGGGGHIFGVIVEQVSGVSLPLALVRIFFREPTEITPRFQRGACYRFFGPPPGVFERAEGIEEARRLPGVLDIGIELTPGTHVGAIVSDADRPGFVVAAGATREEAMAAASAAIPRVKWVMSGSVAG
jgi:biotin carboxylase